MNLMGEVLKRDAGIEMHHVPFRGAAPLVTEMLSGRIQFGGDQLSSSLQHVRSGALKAMAVATPSAAMPDVPTVRAARLPQSGAAGLERLPRTEGHARADRCAAASGDRGGQQAARCRKRMSEVGAEPSGSTPDEMREMLREQIAKVRPIVAELKLTMGLDAAMARVLLDGNLDHLITPTHSDARGPVVRGASIEVHEDALACGRRARARTSIRRSRRSM